MGWALEKGKEGKRGKGKAFYALLLGQCCPPDR